MVSHFHISNKKERDKHEGTLDYSSVELLEEIKKYNVKIAFE